MDGFKTFYNEKKGKYILFFGFYIIFFIFIAIYVRSYNANHPKEEKKEEQVIEKITTYEKYICYNPLIEKNSTNL